MGIRVYTDKENNDNNRFFRRDHDGTEGGDIIQNDFFRIDTELDLVGPADFRFIKETDGLITITARTTREDNIIIAEEKVSGIKPPDDTSMMGEEFLGSFGFGEGDFGQGGFGGTLP